MPKQWIQLSPLEWQQIRAAYEHDPKRPNMCQLARQYGISNSTISKRIKEESWNRHDALALATIKRVKEANTDIVEQTAANVTAQLTKHLTDSLQPWIEREKVRHVRTQTKRAKLALRQLDYHIKPDLVLNPKDSSFIAKTAETWDNIMRRSLGMNDNVPTGTGLTLNVLTNHAAVQVKANTNET